MIMQPTAWKSKLGTDCSAEMLAVPETAKERGGIPFTVAKEPPTVDFVDYPEQTELSVSEAAWSGWNLWGAGTLASDGCFYSAIGDHGGPNGNSYVCQYDPRSQAIRRVLTTQELTNHVPGSWGHGKIHGELAEIEGGWLTFATYWGNRPTEQDFSDDYPGGVLGLYNISTREAENLGAPLPRFSFPTHFTDKARMLMPMQMEDLDFERGGVACYDLSTRMLRFHGGHDTAPWTRGMMLEPESGVSYVAALSEGRNCIGKYDPECNSVSVTKALMPDGDNWRFRTAAGRRTTDGFLYCGTWAGTLVKFDPAKETLEVLGPNFGQGEYSPCLEISPGDRYLYYIPVTAGPYGTPVIQYDTHSGVPKVLAFLAPYYESHYGYHPQGTYALKVHPSGSSLYIPVNGCNCEPGKEKKTYTRTALFVVHVPESERRE